MTLPPPGSSPADRLARREFIRTHHPDAGGDPEAFISGLADLDAREPATRTASEPGPSSAAETASEAAAETGPQAWPVSLTTAALRRLRRRRHNKPHGRSAT